MKERSKLAGGPPQTQFSGSNAEFLRSLPVFAGVVVSVISLLVLVLLVFILSDTPGRTLYFFFLGPFRNIFSFGNMLNAAIPLIIGALGVTVAMKAGNLNLGGEGQIYFGAFCTIAASLFLSKYGIGQFGVIAGVLAVTFGFLCSGLLAAFSGFCKAMWNTSELITSFLLSCAVIPVVNYLVCGPFLDPQTSLQSTRKIAENLRLPLVLKPSGLSAGIFIAAAAVIAVQFFLSRTKPGYEIRMTGSNELFARYGGINTKLTTVISMAISGSFYGLAGSMAVMGTYHAVIKEFSAGLGWNGLAVALISGFYPAAVIPAALFFAWIGAGARIAMQNTGLTFEVASIVQAVIFFISTSVVIRKWFNTPGIKPHTIHTLQNNIPRPFRAGLLIRNIFSQRRKN
ncbi:MAG: ABC transporter permease [Treponema sp.]|jgi:simple sugar transport system permease protein|nr:ABC transporter permease [Treponema sp.]